MEPQLNIAVYSPSMHSEDFAAGAGFLHRLFEAMGRAGCRIGCYAFDAHSNPGKRTPDLKTSLDSEAVILVGRLGDFGEPVERFLADRRREDQAIVLWETGGAASLEAAQRRRTDRVRRMLERFDLVLTSGGGCRFSRAWERLGARQCVPVFGAVNPQTCLPRRSEEGVLADFAFYADHLPGMEAKVAEFFIRPAAMLPDRIFLLAGCGWQHYGKLPKNVKYVGPLTADRRNILHSSSEAVLNLLDTGANGYGPFLSDHFFEAAGAAACVLTEDFEGLESFLMPQSECISVQDGDQVTEVLQTLTMQTARSIGLNARRRMKAEHTCACRAKLVRGLILEALSHAGVR